MGPVMLQVGRIEMPRFRRMLSDARANHISNGRKLALMCQKEIRKRLQKNTKSWREVSCLGLDHESHVDERIMNHTEHSWPSCLTR